MNRKWLVGGLAGLLALAAVLALVVGGLVGRSIIPSPAPEPPQTVRFSDTLTDLAISYPASWEPVTPKDQAIRLLAASPDRSASLSLSARKTDLEPVTIDTLPIVRPLTDDLLSEDGRVATAGHPTPVTLGGLPGYRYTYEFRADDGGIGAHVHYFLFKQSQLVQLVLQAEPASKLEQLAPTFERIARSFQSSGR